MRPSRSSLVVALLTAWAGPAWAAQTTQAAPPTEEITVLGKRVVEPVTPTTSYWVEDAFSDYPLLGANFAQGLVIWNHPDPWNHIGASVPPIRAMEGLAALGWDIVRMQRNSRLNNAGSEGWEDKVARVNDALAQQIKDARAQGYKRIILAGQEVGGAFALEAGKVIDGLYAIVAFAPNTGVKWGARYSPPWVPNDLNNPIILAHTWDQMANTRAERLLVLFPTDDEQVTRARGPAAREILGKRDLPFLLIDETSEMRGNTVADTADFDAYASCLDLFLSPELTPHPGEFHCAADEIPLALAQMGVKPHGGESWFGYSTRGQTIYLELPAGGRGPVVYGWGVGANGKTKAGFRTLDAKFTDESFTANLTPDQALRGVRHGTLYRLTIDLEDGTRAAVALHRLSGNS